MYFPTNYEIPEPRYLKGYDDGFIDCLNSLEKKVKKLGKKYHKDFLLELKNMGGKYCTSTITAHKCNCFLCDLNKT